MSEVNNTATSYYAAEVLGITLPFTNSPAMDIFLLALIASLFVTIINKYLTDQVKIKALRAEMKKLQKKMREKMSEDPKEAQKIQQQIMKKSLENLKHSLNPKILFITMLPLLIVFLFISTNYSEFGRFLNLGFVQFGWLGSYILFSIISSLILKKVLNVA